MSSFQPGSEAEACDLVAHAHAAGKSFSLRGSGTKASLGRHTLTDATLSTTKLSGITLFEPAEMVISARAGTALSLIERILLEQGQVLPFEPMDHRKLLATRMEPTIGGVFATNTSGPGRINRGACRDSAIGVRMVNGRGEIIKYGGRVMKNVTGLDLTKLACGSFGTLGLVTEVSFKVLPAPECSATMVFSGLDDHRAIEALSCALGSPFGPTGAAHLPSGLHGDRSQTLVRIENFSSSVEYRLRKLSDHLKEFGTPIRVDGAASDEIWREVKNVEFLVEPDDRAVWKLSVAPSRGPGVIGKLRQTSPDLRYFYDWGGGLIWLALPSSGDGGAAILRSTLVSTGGHATLVRAPAELRSSVDVFQPLDEPLRRITAGLKASFDPGAIMEPGRMYAGI